MMIYVALHVMMSCRATF